MYSLDNCGSTSLEFVTYGSKVAAFLLNLLYYWNLILYFLSSLVFEISAEKIQTRHTEYRVEGRLSSPQNDTQHSQE